VTRSSEGNFGTRFSTPVGSVPECPGSGGWLYVRLIRSLLLYDGKETPPSVVMQSKFCVE
jgi:hypothetical protein